MLVCGRRHLVRVRLLTNAHFGLICTHNLFHYAALRRLVRSKQQPARAVISFDSRGAVTAPQVFSRESAVAISWKRRRMTRLAQA